MNKSEDHHCLHLGKPLNDKWLEASSASTGLGMTEITVIQNNGVEAIIVKVLKGNGTERIMVSRVLQCSKGTLMVGKRIHFNNVQFNEAQQENTGQK